MPTPPAFLSAPRLSFMGLTLTMGNEVHKDNETTRKIRP